MLLIICSKRLICCISRRQFSCNCWFSLSSKNVLNMAQIEGIARNCFPPFLSSFLSVQGSNRASCMLSMSFNRCHTTPHSFFLHDTLFDATVVENRRQQNKTHRWPKALQSPEPAMPWVERPFPQSSGAPPLHLLALECRYCGLVAANQFFLIGDLF